MDETSYGFDIYRPRNGHWYPEFRSADKGEARFALWEYVRKNPGTQLRIVDTSEES